MKRLQCFVFFSMVFIFQLGCAIPFLDNQAVQNGIVPVLDTQGMKWQDDLCYLTYLCMDEFGQLSFRTYPFSSITMPGIYILAGNVSNQITISVSNVTLDMNGHTVSGGTNGIIINGGLSNITIKNGAIDAVSSDGIQINSGCSAIQICDVAITNAVRAVNVQQVEKSVIKNCDLDLSTTGLVLDECRSITVRNCRARANSHAGYDLLASTTCSLLGCQAVSTGEGNNEVSSELFGFLAKDGNGNIFERCVANATQALSVTGSNSIVAGFALRGSESCTNIIDSESVNSQTNINGVSVPYGILVEQTVSDIAQVASAAVATGTIQVRPRWSPNGKYIVISEAGNVEETRVYLFDRASQALTQVVGIISGDVFDSEWSPDGRFIIVVKSGAVNPDIVMYEFDSLAQTLTEVDSLDTGSVTHLAASWSPDGRFFSLGNNNATVVTYLFDKINKTFSQADSVTGSGENRSVNWSRNGQFLASVNTAGDSTLRIYQFDAGNNGFNDTPIATASLTSIGYFVQFSPDDQYVAVLREDAGVSTTVVIYSFDGTSLTQVASAGPGASFFGDLDWSADGKFLAVAGANGESVVTIYAFDRGSNELFEVGSFSHGATLRGASWSPDGAYIAIAGTAASTIPIRILTGFNSPENNSIYRNTVSCNSGAQFPSGIGISGSNISNYIVGNTAWNNPLPRGDRAPVVSSNYAYVTNVFNQLFGDAPTALQNISLSGIDPIWNRYDIPTKLLRLEALAESLIDNLL